MTWADHDAARGWDDLRAAVLVALGRLPQTSGAPSWMLLSEAAVGGHQPGGSYGDSDRAASSEESEAERRRLTIPRGCAARSTAG